MTQGAGVGTGDLAKVARPVAVGAVPRSRLYRRLDEWRDRRVVWVSAPAGSGKTSLISSYVEARSLPCLWHQVDSGDADLASFFHFLGLAARRAPLSKGRSLPHFTAN